MTRRNPLQGEPSTGVFTTSGARGEARFIQHSATRWAVDVERYPRLCTLTLSARKAELRSDVGDYLGVVQLESDTPASDLLCNVPPGVMRGAAVEWSTLEPPVRGHGVALGMYTLLAMALPSDTALVAHGCVEGGSTSDEAERVWLSIERGSPVGVRGYHGTAYARRNPDPHAEVEALYRDFAHERDRIAGALGEGYNSLQDFTDEEPCPDDDLDRVRRAGVYLLGYDPAIFKQTKRGRELREHLRAWVRWLAWMADRCEERAAAGWWVEGGGWEAPRSARSNPKRGTAPLTVQQVAKAVHQLEHAVDEPDRLTPAVLRVLRAAGWREGDPVHDPRVDYRQFDAQMVVSDLSGPDFDLVGEMWR